jgi:transcriptional regulator with XRE-family HTH domain
VAGRPHLPGFSPELLKQHRKAKGWSQKKLADEAGVDRSLVTKLERPGAKAIAASVKKLADALRVGVEALIEGMPITGLESLRSRKAMSQAEVAGQLGMERTSYAAIENGQILTLLDSVATKLATLFDVEVRDIQEAHRLDVERAAPSLRTTLRLNDSEAAALAALLAGRRADPDTLDVIGRRLEQARAARRLRTEQSE